MDCDQIIDEMLESSPPNTTVDPEYTTPPSRSENSVMKRQRLAAFVAGGKAKKYLGTALTLEQTDTMSDEEIEKLYVKYEARLGALMTKTLGHETIKLYAHVARMFLPIPAENERQLVEDLESDPFVEHALNSAACDLYHRFGMYLAPITAALTTAKHCRRIEKPIVNIYSPVITDSDGASRSTEE